MDNSPYSGPAEGWADALSLVLFGALLFVALVRSGFLLGPPYEDERHFFPSALGLIPLDVSKLEYFEEVSSPTFFIAVSFLLGLLGEHLFWCRLMVLLCLVGCVYVYRSLSREVARSLNLPGTAASSVSC